MNKSECRTLLVKHLPACFTEEDCIDFFKQFGAGRVKYMGQTGKMKHTAFVTFGSSKDASVMLSKLHQLTFLETTLVVEYSKSSSSEGTNVNLKEPTLTNNPSSEDQIIEQEINDFKQQYMQDLNSVSSVWCFDYCLNSNLYYSYPPPSVSILTNIANALASVPKFYVQVLHLMNKMNLPAPFGPVTLTPPMLDDHIPQHLVSKEVVNFHEDRQYSDLESEIESEDEKPKLTETLKRKRSMKDVDDSIRKKLRLQLMMEAQLQTISGNLVKTSSNLPTSDEIFERREVVDKTKKIDIKIKDNLFVPNATQKNKSTDNNIENDRENETSSGFGRIVPEVKKPADISSTTSDKYWEEIEFMSIKDMKKNRLSSGELDKTSAFKNYYAGEPTSRLYIKNLYKSVTENDLHFVFGNYVDWSKEEEKQRYDIVLMKQGRMKGQAFITLPSENHAKKALSDTNGLVLLGKPIAVLFARSAK